MPRQLPNLILLFLYAGVVCALIPFHEPWRDEAQAWLIARDLSIADLFAQMRYEGSPALWHLLLVPFAKLGMPFESQQWLHVGIAILGAGVFIFKSPFQTWQKVAFLFSYFCVYEYAIISRNYCLSLPLLWIVASLYPTRLNSPVRYTLVLALLMQANTHSAIIAMLLAAMLGCEAIMRRRKGLDIWMAAGIAALSAIALYLQIRPPADAQIQFVTFGSPSASVWILKNAFLPEERIPVALWSAGIGATILLTVLWAVRSNWQMLAVLTLPFAAWCFLHLTKHAGGLRHWGFVMLVSVFALWVQLQNKANVENGKSIETQDTATPTIANTNQSKWFERAGGIGGVALFASLLFSLLQGARFIKRDLSEPFSGARQMATHIHDAGYTAPIAAFTAPRGSALLPYLPGKKLWYPQFENDGTFITWNTDLLTEDRTKQVTLDQRQVVERVIEQFGNASVLLLLNEPIDHSLQEHWRLLHAESVGTWSRTKESYYLYQRTTGMSQNAE